MKNLKSVENGMEYVMDENGVLVGKKKVEIDGSMLERIKSLEVGDFKEVGKKGEVKKGSKSELIFELMKKGFRDNGVIRRILRVEFGVESYYSEVLRVYENYFEENDRIEFEKKRKEKVEEKK
jgi:hypothetical protein